jgi:rRNA-processing protein FCF1
MILEKQTEAHILEEGTTQETVKMSLDLDSAQVLMQMLSKNLYSDSIGSTIRECASNALDSHRRAGCDEPIIVSFKRNSQADTYEFAVEDFGIGLDADDVVNIISKYGKSTKRDSNTELGMMGLGFKAPLAYSSSFYFVARKDFMERKYMMYEGEDTNSIDLLYEKPTAEPNGVKVIVPVTYYDRYNFVNKIKEQLAYFDNVYFDVEPMGSYNVPNDFTIHRAEHFQYSQIATNNDMHLCLDNVSYPIDWEKLGIERIRMKMALRFSLSDGLFPTPNREALRYTQEAKQTILKKIAMVANVFMDKFNDAITTQSDIKAIMEFYSQNSKHIKCWYKGTEDDICIDDLVKHSTVAVAQPKLDNIKLLNLERLAVKSKEYILAEYKFKYRFSNGKFQNAKNYYYEHLRMSDLTGYAAGGVYIYDDSLPKGKQDYLRTLLPDNKTSYFVKKSAFKLRSKTGQTDYGKYYDSVLNLSMYPRTQWRQLIQEFQYVVGLYAKDFIDVDAIDVPQSFKDAQKAKRMKVTVAAIAGPKKVRLKGEFSGKVGTQMQIDISDQYCKFVPTTFKMEDIHKLKTLHVYAKEADKKKMDNAWSCFNKHASFVLVAQATYDNLQKADLHNWITIDKFMEGKNRPFKTIATEFLIRDLIETYSATFKRINTVKDISIDLADKLQILHQYHNSQYRSYADDATRKAVIEHAIANNLFDQPTYLVYKQVNEVFTKLPFLDAILDTMGYSNVKQNPLIAAIVDLFKYHKHKVNLEHYKIKLTEDAPLEETLTQDTIEELQTI